MSDQLPATDLMEMLLAALEATNAGIATLSREVAELRSVVSAMDTDSQASLAAIAQLVGLTYVATANSAPPADVLDSPVMTKFLDSYPIDGPPLLPSKQWAETIAAMRLLSTPADVQKERDYFERHQASASALTRAISRQLIAQLDEQSGVPKKEVPGDRKDPPAPFDSTRSH